MEDPFEKQIITPEMFPTVTDFMWENFFSDEPMARSVKMTKNWLTDRYFLVDTMKDGCSIAAVDKDDNIVGARLGIRRRRSDWIGWIMDRSFFLLPTGFLWFVLPKEFEAMPIIQELFNKVEFNAWAMFDHPTFGCDLIYEPKALCSARSFRMKGLATELCRRTENLARDLGCKFIYAAVTGDEIFRN